MGQTLTNGIYLPAEGERNCYEGLAANWTALDGMIGGYNVHISNTTIHVTAADKEAWNGKADASALTAHTGDTTIHVTSADKQAWNGKADASALTAHTGDTTIHVTSADKQAWNGKADSSALTAHTGDTTIHVTAEDKAKWDAVTGKADDADVVHKSGAETIAGPKTFNSSTSIYNSDNSAVTPNLYLRSSKIEIAAQGNTSGGQNLAYADKNNTVYAYVKGDIQSNGSAVIIRAFCKDNSDNSIINEIQILANTNGRKIIFPSNTNETELGTSSYKWKDVNTVLINGLTPSGLGMLSNTYVDITGYVTDLTGGNNIYTALDNGIVAVDISGTNRYVLYNNNLSIGDRLTGTNFRRAGMIQVRKNDAVIIQLDGGRLNYARFIPCQGNI